MADRLLGQGIDPQRLIFLNMESLSNSPYTDYRVLHAFVMERYQAAGARLYLFLDEVQEISSWEKAVNSFLADDVADLYLTGSNSERAVVRGIDNRKALTFLLLDQSLREYLYGGRRQSGEGVINDE